MPNQNDTTQHSTCGKCGGRIVRQGKFGWYHLVPALHSPRHYAEPAVQAIFSPAVFAATVHQMTRHIGLVGDLT